jgi:NAD(P)-dependent dehydrogenase (short-subunit alcohol dehydrogenase family)
MSLADRSITKPDEALIRKVAPMSESTKLATLPQDFVGKTALITGASRGIGLQIAAELAGRGARVVITARKHGELETAVEQLGGSGTALGIQGCADDEAHQHDAVKETVSTFGSLDILVNNAGINPYFGPFLEANLAVFRKTIDVNLIACFSWVQVAYRAWMREHGGSILNVSSIAGLRTGTPLNIYGVSKAGLIYMTQRLAVELGPEIRVNGIAPAVVKTRFARAMYEVDEYAAASRYPMKRLGTPDDIAKLAAFLLGPDAAWITGEIVAIDGGALAASGGGA